MRRLLLAVGLLLVIAPAAHAGGWATVELSSTPAGTAPGAPWDVNITVLQHGVTPLNDVNPAVTIASGDATKTFAASRPPDRATTARAVVFPTAGRWKYAVDDGFISEEPHTYPPVQIQGTARRPRRRPDERAEPGVADRRDRAAARRGGAAVARDSAPPPAAGGVRATTLAAGGLACAGAAMTIAAFAGAGPRADPGDERTGARGGEG